MSHIMYISDDKYHVAETLAAERGQTPEELITSLLNEAWERECARHDAAFDDDPSWLEGARQALAEAAAGQTSFYPSTEALFRHLGAGTVELEAARQLDQAETPNADADVR